MLGQLNVFDLYLVTGAIEFMPVAHMHLKEIQARENQCFIEFSSYSNLMKMLIL